jgi:hypothetical protein
MNHTISNAGEMAALKWQFDFMKSKFATFANSGFN